MPDSVLERLADNGGVVMVTFVPAYVSQPVSDYQRELRGERARLEAMYPNQEQQVQTLFTAWREQHPAPEATVADVADHIDHVRDGAGIEHIGLGGDFDGIASLPRGLEDVSSYPRLLEELARRGYSDGDLAAIAGENVLRVMAEAESAAARLQTETPAADPPPSDDA